MTTPERMGDDDLVQGQEPGADESGRRWSASERERILHIGLVVVAAALVAVVLAVSGSGSGEAPTFETPSPTSELTAPAPSLGQSARPDDLSPEQRETAEAVVRDDPHLTTLVADRAYATERVEPLTLVSGETVGALVFVALELPLDLVGAEVVTITWDGNRRPDGSWYTLRREIVTLAGVRLFVVAVDFETSRVVSEVPVPPGSEPPVG